MPRYGRHRYGRFKYGKYMLSSGGGGGGHSIGPHVRYRIRTITHDGTKSDFITMCENRVSIPSTETARTRIRADKGEWVCVQNAMINSESIKVRIRSVKEDGETSEWVYGDRGNLQT